MEPSLTGYKYDKIWVLVVTFTHSWSNMVGLVEMVEYLVVWYTNLMVVEMITSLTFKNIFNITTS